MSNKRWSNYVFKERFHDYKLEKSDGQPRDTGKIECTRHRTKTNKTKTELTSRLLDYLPNALAFIYVINSSNAGGLQGDRVDILSFCFVSHF
jgi:hypothetical protein